MSTTMSTLTLYHVYYHVYIEHVACLLQAAQVRKAAFVGDGGGGYDPERHQSSTVYMGTTVQQVRTTA